MSTIYSYAKINLFLHIIERNKDNYHEIQSLMSFINLYDEIYIEDSDYLKINFEYNDEIKFPEINMLNNSILEIINNFSKVINKNINLSIRIKKNIPIGSGLAGGSGNAAVILKYLQKKYSYKLSTEDEKKIALKIGCDTVPCLYGKTLLAEGIGDKISLCKLNDKLQNSHILIIYPQIISLSKELYGVFKKHNYKFTETIQIPQIIGFNFLKKQHNDLKDVFVQQFPEIKKLIFFLDQYRDNVDIITGMSGSGSTFFILSKDKNQIHNIKAQINDRFKKYYVKICSFISSN